MEQTSVIMLAVAVILAIMSFAATSKPVAASSDPPAVVPSWATWAFELAPSNGQYDALWTITIGGEDKGGDPVVLHQETMSLVCKPIDEVMIDDDVILFKGGYLECDFPDLIATANSIIRAKWGGGYELKIGADCKCKEMVAPYEPYATVSAIVGESAANPVFDHPSIGFSLDVAAADVANWFAISGEESSGKGELGSGLVTYRSTFGCEKDLGYCRFRHFQGGNLVEEEKVQYRVATFYTGSVTVQIGKRGTGKERFLGAIESLEVDPGCRVN